MAENAPAPAPANVVQRTGPLPTPGAVAAAAAELSGKPAPAPKAPRGAAAKAVTAARVSRSAGPAEVMPAAGPTGANVVQRQGDLPKPGGPMEFSEPKVTQFKRQYQTDFADGDDAGGARELPTGDELASAGEGDTAAQTTADGGKGKPKASMNARTATPTEVKEHDDAQKPATEAAEEAEKPAVPLLSKEDRRKALEALDAEDRRRTNEQTLATERQRYQEIDAKLKGSLVDRLVLAFPDIKGTPDEVRDQLIDMLVAGTIKLPTAGATPAASAAMTPEQERIKALEDKLARLDPTTPANADAGTRARLAQVAAEVVAKGVPLPFSTKPGATIVYNGQNVTADDLRVKVTKALWKMQGEKGHVDGPRVCQVVEGAFEEHFVKQWGEDAAAVIRGGKAPAPKPAPAAPAPVASKPPQRRGTGGRGAHAGTVGGDPLPLANITARHKAIQSEIDAMEGTIHFGPR